MESLRGKVEKIRIIKMTDSPLIYFKMSGKNCLIARHSLNFLADVAEGCNIVVYGCLNTKNQFVCKKYTVIGKPQIILDFEQSKFPRRVKS